MRLNPLLRRSKTDTGASEGPPPEPQGVVVICDNADSRELLSRLVERDGHRAARAASIDEGLVALEQSSTVAAVVSLASSGGNLKALEAIRTAVERGVAGVPVIILADTDRNQTFAWQSGADGFVVRPFHEDELRDELAAAISRPDDERAAHRNAQLDAV